MARTSGIGLNEKYINDDSLSDRLEKFDAVLQSTFLTAQKLNLVTIQLDDKKRVSSYTVL